MAQRTGDKQFMVALRHRYQVPFKHSNPIYLRQVAYFVSTLEAVQSKRSRPMSERRCSIITDCGQSNYLISISFIQSASIVRRYKALRQSKQEISKSLYSFSLARIKKQPKIKSRISHKFDRVHT